MLAYVPTFEGFLSETLASYNYGCEEAAFLRWFHRFASSGKMESLVNPADHKTYYRISYQKVLRDFPFLKITKRKVGYYFDNLCGILLDTRDKNATKSRDASREYPLKKLVLADKEYGGSKVFFAINELGFQQFLPETLDWQGSKEYQRQGQDPSEEKEKSSVIYSQHKSLSGKIIKKKREKPTKDMTAKTRKLVEKLLGAEDSPFKHRLNAPGEPTSWLFLKVEEYFMALLGGTFLKACPLKEDWVAHVDTSVLQDLRNSWETLEEYCLHALRAYQEWIRESRDSSMLPRDLSRWLYNPVTGKSLFLSCLTRAHTQRGFAAEKVQESSFDPQTKEILEDFKKDWWSASAYWLGMRSVYQYLYRNWTALREAHGERWRLRHISKMMENYCFFLDRQKSVDPNSLGLGGPLWKAFLNDFFNSTGIDLEIQGETRNKTPA